MKALIQQCQTYKGHLQESQQQNDTFLHKPVNSSCIRILNDPKEIGILSKKTGTSMYNGRNSVPLASAIIDCDSAQTFEKQLLKEGERDRYSLQTPRKIDQKQSFLKIVKKRNSSRLRSQSIVRNSHSPGTKGPIFPFMHQRESHIFSRDTEIARLNDKLDKVFCRKYRLEKRLGQGSYSTTYLAYDTDDFMQKFAIKIVKNNKQSLLQEYDNMKRLDHPAIIKAIELLRDEETIYGIVMELGGERTLKDRQMLQSGSVFPEPLALYYFTQIARGLQHMHMKGIAHCDLKAENITLCASTNTIKIIDMGFSCRVDTIRHDCVSGTLTHMTPQQVNKQACCPFKADVWCLGIVLYNMLYNSYLFKAKTLEERSAKFKLYQLSFPKYHKVTSLTKNLLKRMLAFEEENRASINDILSEFSLIFLH